MADTHPALIAQDLRTIRQRLLESNRFDSTLQQLMTQLDTFNRNEELVENWALGAAAQVDEAGAAMEEVVSAFGQVAQLVSEISEASGEQSAGISQVTQAVSKMEEVTQHNAALVEQASAAAQSLEQQAQGLMDIVAGFRLQSGAVVTRDAGRGAPPPAQRQRA